MFAIHILVILQTRHLSLDLQLKHVFRLRLARLEEEKKYLVSEVKHLRNHADTTVSIALIPTSTSTL